MWKPFSHIVHMYLCCIWKNNPLSSFFLVTFTKKQVWIRKSGVSTVFIDGPSMGGTALVLYLYHPLNPPSSPARWVRVIFLFYRWRTNRRDISSDLKAFPKLHVLAMADWDLSEPRSLWHQSRGSIISTFPVLRVKSFLIEVNSWLCVRKKKEKLKKNISNYVF